MSALPARGLAQFQITPAEPEFLSIGASLWLNGASIIVGALVALLIAVYLTPKLTAKSAKRDQQERILRTLINTWQIPANPDYQHSIALIPIDFKGIHPVITARSDYLAFVNSLDPAIATEEESIEHSKGVTKRAAALIAAIASHLDFELTEQSLTDGIYVTKGFVDREMLIQDALGAWGRIAVALEDNNKLYRELIASQAANNAAQNLPDQAPETPAA